MAIYLEDDIQQAMIIKSAYAKTFSKMFSKFYV